MRLSNSFGFTLFLLLLREKHEVFLLICLFLLITKVFLKFKRILFGKNIRWCTFKSPFDKWRYHMIELYKIQEKKDEISAICQNFSEKPLRKLSPYRKEHKNLGISKDHEYRDSFKCPKLFKKPSLLMINGVHLMIKLKRKCSFCEKNMMRAPPCVRTFQKSSDRS